MSNKYNLIFENVETGEQIRIEEQLKHAWGDTVYIVHKGIFTTKIIKTRVDYITFTNMMNYKVEYRGWFIRNDDLDVFTTKEDAMKYAETLEKRRKIRIKEIG